MTKKEAETKTTTELLDMVKGYIPPKLTYRGEGEESEEQGYFTDRCPYDKCDGSGLVKFIRNDKRHAEDCDCLKERQLRSRLEKSNIKEKYWRAELNFDKTFKGILLEPKEEPLERKIDKRLKNQPPEGPDEYIKRVYEKIKIKNINLLGEDYTQTALSDVSMIPRIDSKGLALMGKPGCGKTTLACAIGKEFLKDGKSVYFSTMQNLLDQVYDDDFDLKKLAKKTDLLIIDEMGNEYHTDTRWAVKTIKELFKIRSDAFLPTILTSNYYPNGFDRLYDEAIMSMFNGEFLLVCMERSVDKRIEKAKKDISKYSFLDRGE